MTKKIVDLDIEKVAGVEAAANRRTFLVVKEDSPKGGLFDRIKKFFDNGAVTVSEVLDNQEMREELWELDDALRISVASILEDDSIVDKRAAIGETLSQYLAELVSSGIVKVDKVPKQRMGLLKSLGEAIEGLDKVMEIEKGSDSMSIDEKVLKDLPEDVQAQIAELQKDADENAELVTKNEELTTKVDELVTKVDELTPEPKEDVLKGATPEVIEKMEAMQKQLDSAEAVAKAEKETRITKEYNDTASKELNELGDTETFAKILRGADEVSPEHGKEVLEKLKSANARVKGSDLFKEHGSDGEGETDVYSKIQARSAEIAKSEGITKEQAEAKFLKTSEGAELHKQYEGSVN